MKSIEMHFLSVQWEILDGIQRVTMDVYSLKDLEMTSYKREGRTFRYPVKKRRRTRRFMTG